MTAITRYLCTFMILAFFSLSAQAEIYSYISESTQVSSSRINYKYTIASWSPPPVGSPNPCNQLGLTKSCYANVDHRHTEDDRGGIGTKDTAFRNRCKNINLSILKDGRDVYNAIYNSCFGGLPYSGETYHRGDVIRNECVTLFLSKGYNDDRGYMYPGAICGVAPPPGGICSFDVRSPNVVLDHGRLPDDAIDGNTVSEYITMKCSKSMTVRIYSITDLDDRLKLKQNLYSRLTLNNMSLGSAHGGVPIYVPAGSPADAELKSTLETRGAVTPGPFSGRISIIMTID